MKIVKKILKGLLVITSLLLACIFIFSGLVAYWVATLKIPDVNSLKDLKVAQSTKIYDKTGKIILWDVHENVQRTVVPLENISRHIKNATVAIEDSGFYQHKGIDITGILRSIFIDLTSGKLKQGGSTISQQLTKNTLLTTEKTISRKIKEIILTLKIEKNLSKDEILSLYLNGIPYGGSTYGVQAASKTFFGKDAADVTLAEASYLASLPKAPTHYSPYGNHRGELEDRKNTVLSRMLDIGFITKEEFDSAKKEQTLFINKGDNSIKAPHFSMYIKNYLEDKYGKDVVEQGGLKVITTLDFNLQQKAEAIAFKYAKENKEKFRATNNSLVAIDPKTGQILAMVGSKDYFNQEDQGNFNVALSHRQPGSSIKPFIYAAAIEKGYTPETVLFDVPTEFNASCSPDGAPKTGLITPDSTNNHPNDCYMPENYDHKYRGPVDLRNSLARSLNIPSVKALYLAGLNNSLNLLKNMGITSLNDPDRFGLTLVLGGGEVSLLEMTGAYSVLANNGIRNPVSAIIKIEDKNGKTLEEFKDQSKQVLDKNIALTITDILSDNEARTPAFGPNSPLYFPDTQVAAKTGTSNDSRDAWVFGYTPNIAVGTWFGNNDNSPMEKKVAGFIVAPMWREFLLEAFKITKKEDFEKPKKTTIPLKPVLKGEWRGGQIYLIDSISKKLATEFTPPELIEEKVLTEIHSILYWLDKNNPNGDKPQDPKNDPQFDSWEYSIRKWAQEQNIKDQTIDDIPKDKDDVHKPEYAPKIKIENLDLNKEYNKDDFINIKISSSSKFGLSQVDLFFNNTYIGSSKQEPFGFLFKPDKYGVIQKNSEIKIITYDKMRNKTEVNESIRFITN